MIRDVLISQKNELFSRFQEKYVKREVSFTNLENNLIKVVTGPRRSGKSFFTIHELKNKIGNFGYVNFDDERLLKIINYDEIISYLNSIYGNPKYFFFDEIQNLDKWELFVNRLQRSGFNIIISGSNSNLLSTELATHLTGRHIELKLFPFSFSEYLSLFSDELTAVQIKEKYFCYLENGGYPEPLINKINTSEYLRTLFDSIIYKDILKRHKIRISGAIDNLAMYLISNISNEFSYRNLLKTINSGSVNTVKKFVNYLEESWLFFQLNRFSYKIREQINYNKKIYCIDNGLVRAKGFSSSPDRGKSLENLVAIHLKRKEFSENNKVYFWKNHLNEEVDFVVKENLKIKSLIQVCVNLENPYTYKREIRALVKAGNDLNCKNLIILTEETEKEEVVKFNGFSEKVNFIPVWKWIIK
jgi:uncharacterized protein